MLNESDRPGDGSSHILDEASELLKARYGRELQTIRVERLVIGVFCSGVKLSNGSGGIAYTPPETMQRAGRRILKGGRSLMRGMSVAEALAGGDFGPFSEVARLSLLNALSVPFLNQANYTVGAGEDVTDYPQLFINKKVCMVGAIIPTLKRLKELGARDVTVIDKKKATQEEADFGNFIPLEHTEEALAQCDTALFTGAAIANGTIEDLIRPVSSNAAIIIVGPTAGFIPDPLFRRDVAMTGTVAVTNSDLALDYLSEGGGAYQLFKTCLRKLILINPQRTEDLNLHHH